jgi:hypothetical protein
MKTLICADWQIGREVLTASEKICAERHPIPHNFPEMTSFGKVFPEIRSPNNRQKE